MGTLQARQVWGALRGLETFQQLIYDHPYYSTQDVKVVSLCFTFQNFVEGILPAVYVKDLTFVKLIKAHLYLICQYVIDSVKINDRPRFQHRGIMIDTSRHYLKKATILQNLVSLKS